MFYGTCLHLKRVFTSGSNVTRLFSVANSRYQAVGSASTTEAGSEKAGPSPGSEGEVRERVLKAALTFVPQLGWSTAALAAGARKECLPSVAHGMFARGGVELALYFYESSNQQLVSWLIEQQTDGEKKSTVSFIGDAMEKRLRMQIPYISSWPQAMVLMSLPRNLPDSFSNLAYLVNNVWYYAGDRSVDLNWYTKRAGLMAAYKTSELCLLQDRSDDYEQTWAFLRRRLENFSQFAKLTRKVPSLGDIASPDNLIAALQVTRNILGLNSRTR